MWFSWATSTKLIYVDLCPLVAHEFVYEHPHILMFLIKWIYLFPLFEFLAGYFIVSTE